MWYYVCDNGQCMISTYRSNSNVVITMILGTWIRAALPLALPHRSWLHRIRCESFNVMYNKINVLHFFISVFVFIRIFCSLHFTIEMWIAHIYLSIYRLCCFLNQALRPAQYSQEWRKKRSEIVCDDQRKVQTDCDLSVLFSSLVPATRKFMCAHPFAFAFRISHGWILKRYIYKFIYIYWIKITFEHGSSNTHTNAFEINASQSVWA